MVAMIRLTALALALSVSTVDCEVMLWLFAAMATRRLRVPSSMERTERKRRSVDMTAMSGQVLVHMHYAESKRVANTRRPEVLTGTTGSQFYT
jgi:hypothetical protein